MRPLTEEETRIFFEKLAKYIGSNIKYLINRSDHEYVFRLHNERIYYCNVDLLKYANHYSNESIVSIGICFGKFTKTKKFRLHITSLPYLAQYAKYKIWIKSAGEMNYLYGHNITKQHLGRITESTPQYSGCVVYNMNDIPLGFAVTAYSTNEMRKLAATSIVGFHQADIGEYLRVEQEGEHVSGEKAKNLKEKTSNESDIGKVKNNEKRLDTKKSSYHRNHSNRNGTHTTNREGSEPHGRKKRKIS